MSVSPSDLEAARRARLFLAANSSSESFDRLTLQGLQLVSAQPGCVVCRLVVSQQLQNRYATLHGGATGEQL